VVTLVSPLYETFTKSDVTVADAAAALYELLVQLKMEQQMVEKEKVYALSYAVVTAFVRDNPGVFWWSALWRKKPVKRLGASFFSSVPKGSSSRGKSMR